MAMAADLDRFYSLLAHLEAQPSQGSLLSTLTGRLPWPARGVYFFRESGEERARMTKTLRIVRVGTHAISTGSKSKLWGRLRSHRGSHAGGGNHRGSVFRLHVGAALLRRADAVNAHLSWGKESSASKEIRGAEADIERRVSAHIGAMTVLWIEVADEAGVASDRAFIERNSIALLSAQLNPADPPSESWLGLSSPQHLIRESGLWNLNHVVEPYDPSFLDRLEACVVRTASGV